MGTTRVEAFSDGVLAIIITIMVLELKVPHGTELGALRPLVPVALYGVVLLMAAIAYWILQQRIIAAEGPESRLVRAVRHDLKGKISPVIYVIAIAAAFVATWISGVLYVGVALMWLIPDRRIERILAGPAAPPPG